MSRLEGYAVRAVTKPDLYTASSETNDMRNSRPQLKSTVSQQGRAFPGLRKVLRHKLQKAECSAKADHS